MVTAIKKTARRKRADVPSGFILDLDTRLVSENVEHVSGRVPAQRFVDRTACGRPMSLRLTTPGGLRRSANRVLLTAQDGLRRSAKSVSHSLNAPLLVVSRREFGFIYVLVVEDAKK